MKGPFDPTVYYTSLPYGIYHLINSFRFFKFIKRKKNNEKFNLV